MTWHDKKLRDFFNNFDAKNPNHLAAVDLLQSHVPGVMSDAAEWVKQFRKPLQKTGTGKIPQEALDIIKEFEGFRSSPYICPAGFATIGYGNTYYPATGQRVLMGDPPITHDMAESILTQSLEKDFLPKLEKIPHWDEMSDGQRSALLSFAYNLGANFYGDTYNFGSITRDLKEKNWANVPATLLKYRNPGSSFEEGLRKRRTEEGKIWNS